MAHRKPRLVRSGDLRARARTAIADNRQVSKQTTNHAKHRVNIAADAAVIGSDAGVACPQDRGHSPLEYDTRSW